MLNGKLKKQNLHFHLVELLLGTMDLLHQIQVSHQFAVFQIDHSKVAVNDEDLLKPIAQLMDSGDYADVLYFSKRKLFKIKTFEERTIIYLPVETKEFI